MPLDLRALETFTEIKGHFNFTHFAFESGNKREQHMGPRENILPTAYVIKEANLQLGFLIANKFRLMASIG